MSLYERKETLTDYCCDAWSCCKSVYKTRNNQFTPPALGYRNMSHIVIGDFNRHSTSWGYNVTDDKGEAFKNGLSHAISHKFTMLNYLCPSIVQNGRKESTSLYETYNKQYVSSPISSSTMESGTKLLEKTTEER